MAMRTNHRNDGVNDGLVEAPFSTPPDESLEALELAYDRTLFQLCEDPTNTMLAVELDSLEDAIISYGGRFDHPRSRQGDL